MASREDPATPLCHQCEWNDRPASDAKTRACVECPGPGAWLTNKGRTHVSVDAGGAQTAAEVEASMQTRAGDGVAFDPDAPEYRAAMEQGAMRLLLYFKALTKEQVVLIWHLLNSGSLAAAAAELGRTRAMLSHLWRELLKDRPELARVLDGSETSPAPAKKPARDEDEAYRQDTLF